MSTRALKVALAAQVKADVGVYFSVTLISLLAARGVVKREDLVLIFDSLRRALPAASVAYEAELRNLSDRAVEVFDRLDGLRQERIESGVKAARGAP